MERPRPAPPAAVARTRLTFLRFLGFLSGFFFSQPRARIPYPVSPHPLHAPTPLVLGPQPALGDACGDSVPWSS